MNRVYQINIAKSLNEVKGFFPLSGSTSPNNEKNSQRIAKILKKMLTFG